MGEVVWEGHVIEQEKREYLNILTLPSILLNLPYCFGICRHGGLYTTNHTHSRPARSHIELLGSGCHPSEASSKGVFHGCPEGGGGRRWAQGTVSFSCSPVGPKKTGVAELHLDPAAMSPSLTPWVPSLALPKLSTLLSVERIQHPGQGPQWPYSTNL